MRFKVFYAIICVLLLVSCAVSSFSSRTTNRSLYQKSNFKKPEGFKMSNSKNDLDETFQTGNSILNISKIIGVAQDSIVPETNHHEIIKLTIQKFDSNQNKDKLAHIFKTLINPPKDSTYVDPKLAKEIRLTYAKGIIGAVFAHVGLAVSICAFAALSAGLIGTLIILSLLGIVFSFIGMLLSIETMKDLRRHKNFNKTYFIIAIISLVFSIMGIIAALGSLLLLIGLAFSGI